MLVVGLTGSIGMGKSTTSTFFRDAGVPVHDADATVHRLYAGEAAPLIEAAFPGTTKGGVVDRTLLGARVLGDAAAIRKLEATIHPLVGGEERKFRERCRAEGRTMIVLDIPLLFETGGERRVDVVALVSAPASVQRERVLSRPGMTVEKFEAILARQMPDAEKRRRAHIIIDTGRNFDAARRQVQALIRTFAGAGGSHA